MATQSKWRVKAREFVESSKVQKAIVGLILFNSISIGIETSREVMDKAGHFVDLFDDIILGIFIVELSVKIYAYRWRFFRSSWNLFDFIIIGVSLLPESGILSIFRTLRIIRVLRLFKQLERLRVIIEAFLKAIASIGWISLLLGIIFYVFAVISTNIFGQAFPHWFGDLGKSTYTLFQIMTLESWSMGIVRPVMEKFPYAYLLFVPFILVATYITVNIFIAVVVSAMNEIQFHENEAKHEKDMEGLHNDSVDLQQHVIDLKNEIKELKASLNRMEERMQR